MQIQQAGCSCGFLLEGKEPVKLKNVPVIYPDRPGVNRNVYPKEELIKAVEYYKKLVQIDPTYKYALAKHPKDESEEWLGLIAGVIDDLYFNEETNRLEMDVTLLPTVWGHFIAWALDNGYVIGTSIRGSSKEEPGTWELGGEVISVVIRRNLLLEGVDFVLYPSFITTHATEKNLKEATQNAVPFSKVVESYVSSLTCEEDKERIYKMLVEGKELEEIKEQSGGNSMGDKNAIDIKELELQTKQLHLDIQRSNMELKDLELKKIALTKELEEKNEELKEVNSKLEELKETFNGKNAAISELSKVVEQHKKEIEELEQKKLQLEKELAELEDKKKQIAEYIKVLEKKSDNKVSVKFGGKVYDEDNPPKLRVVPIADKVSSAGWDDVDKDKLRKLVWLAGDEGIAKKVFGLVESMDSWKDLKYPVYQPMKSEEEGYDVDLVLNRNGLATAVAFVFGRPGWALSAKEKKQLIKFLVSKYKELQKEGIADVPPKLRKAAERLKVLEKVEINGEDAAPIIEFAILTGLVDIEIDDKIQEKVEVDIDEESLHILAEAVLKMITGEFDGNSLVVEQAGEGKNILLRMLKKPDGTPTSFADKYELTGKEEFEKFIKDTVAKFKEDVSDGLERIRDAVFGFVEGSVDNSEEVKTFLSEVFDFLGTQIEEIEEKTGEEKKETQQTETPKETPEEETTPAKEQTEHKEDDEKNGGIDMELFKKLKDYIESRFEDVVIENEDDLIAFIEKISSDYTELFNQIQELELEKVKEQKISELVEMGIDREVIEEELDGVESVDELEAIMDKLVKVVKKVQESRKHDDVLGNRKSLYKPGGTKDDGKKDITVLDKLLSTI